MLVTTPIKRWALKGRIVTMAAKGDVVANGTIYVDNGHISAIAHAGQPAPAGFDNVPTIDSGGTAYPGLIELHNHLSYNILPLWQVPKAFTNRAQWQDIVAYRVAVTGPMTAIATADDGHLLPAIVRYVESKCLLGGTTTSQGITLSNWSGTIHKYYKGVLRTAEIGHPPELAAAHSKIPDIDARDWTKFENELKSSRCFLLHLSEGIDAAAREHFLALRNAQNQWAIEPSLAGIHCTALTAADFAIMAEHKASMVWSPLSNLLLYGKTADVVAARNAGLTIALGPDWSPSGSKNLLGELKAAKAANDVFHLGFDDFDLAAMATRNAAKILGWSKAGTLANGQLADLVVIAGQGDDPYAHLIKAREDNVSLVAIGGRARYGLPAVMQTLGAGGEHLKVAGADRVVDFDAPDDDAGIERVTLADATQRLTAALGDLGALQRRSMHLANALASGQAVDRPGWRLALDEQFHNHVELRPRLALAGAPTGPDIAAARAAAPALHPVKLDPLTVADDPGFVASLRTQMNLPAGMAAGIAKLYGV
jgi:5-methylthioadenosine/S-adenosylhomocysteine deaminase